MGTPLRHQNLKKLKTLFLSTLYISAFTFGGGFVIVGFMRRKFVHDLHWIDEEEMLDFAALAQSCPGAVAVNAAILIGWKICGFAGMLTAVLGTILPPMIILSVISLFYSAFASSPLISAVLHGMEAGVAATVLDVACDLGMATVKTKSSLSIFIMAGAFVLNFVFHVSVIYISQASDDPALSQGGIQMIYIQLFFSFLKIGLFSVGGGYAAIPLIQSEIVNGHGWLSMQEFTNLITISSMTPGPVAINSATFVGLRIAGLPGAVTATLGSIFPAVILVSLLSLIYRKYKGTTAIDTVLGCLRPAVVALITAAGLSLSQTALWGELPVSLSSVDWINALLFLGAFFILRKWKWNPILVMCLCGAGGLISFLAGKFF